MKNVLFKYQILKESDYQISIHNRGFLFGDGFFETMIFRQSQLLYFEDHLERIHQAIAAYGFEMDIDTTLLKDKLIELIQLNHPDEDATVKLLFFRAEGGLFTPHTNACDFLAITRGYKKPASEKSNVRFFNKMRVVHSPLSPYKSLSSSIYVQAGVFLKEHGLDDVIITGAHGVIAECLYSNIYWMKNNEVYTPSIESGCVSGIARKRFIHACKMEGITVNEGLFRQDDLMNADCAFNTNVAGYSVMKKIENKAYTDLPEVIKGLLS